MMDTCKILQNSLKIIAFICLSTIVFTSQAVSFNKTGDTNFGSVRFIQSSVLSDLQNNEYMVGIHISLEKGWKTYWKVPGDAGIPPSFDWKQSKNIESLEVLWPAPKRMKDTYGTLVFGYEKEVVFPIKIKVKNGANKADLKLKFAYGVCKDICILKEEVFSKKLPGATTSNIKDHKLLSDFIKRVPEKISHSINKAPKPTLPFLKAVMTDIENEKKPYIMLDVVYPKNSAKNDIFIEVSDNYFIALPKKHEAPSTAQKVTQYHIDLTKGDPAKDLLGKTIKLTLVSQFGQSETSWVVK